MQRASREIVQIIEPVVTGLGLEFVGAEFGNAENGQTLRVYIDKQGGVVLDDCAMVSRQLNAVMDVEDSISSAYLLEVSSPGVDRPLFTAAQFAEQQGQVVRAKLSIGVDGRRNFKGAVVSVDETSVTVEVDGIDYQLLLDDIEQSYLVGKLS